MQKVSKELLSGYSNQPPRLPSLVSDWSDTAQLLALLRYREDALLHQVSIRENGLIVR